ncbi:MAG: hypothetical protein IJX46_06630 [Clostridia bacterium]|nr:hypothetical protein [Clostridia bacterium]
MKRFILAAILIAALILGLCFNAYAAEPPALDTGYTEIVVTEPVETPETTEVTETPETTETPIPETTYPTDIIVPGGGTVEEERMELTELIHRIWSENKELIFSAISALFSIIVWILTSKRYIPKIYAGMKKLLEKLAEQKTDLDGFKSESDKRLTEFDRKIASFENYDKTAAEVKEVLAKCQLDREVLIKVIQMQAEELNHIIEISGLPQVRKDQLYAEYQAQLKEVERLKGEGAND